MKPHSILLPLATTAALCVELRAQGALFTWTPPGDAGFPSPDDVGIKTAWVVPVWA